MLADAEHDACALSDFLHVDHVGVRRCALVLWRHIHPGAPVASPEREQLLGDPHPALRVLLAEIAAETADRKLLELLSHDQDVRVRHRASSAEAAAADSAEDRSS